MPISNGFPPDPYRGVGRPMFRTLGISASGLSAQRLRMEVIATNLANAEVTRTEEGGEYRRRIVQLEARTTPGQPYEVDSTGAPSRFRLPGGDPLEPLQGVRVVGIAEDATEGPLVYEPGHPDANAEGYVRYPNVRATDELIHLMEARRVFEANATVFQAAKAMLRRSIDI